MAPAYRLYLRAEDRTRVGEIDDYLGAGFTLRFNAPGRWQVTLPASSPLVGEVKPGCGLVLVRDGVTLLSGPMRQYKRVSRAVAGEGGGEEDTLTIGGPDDTGVLRRRLALPVPLTATPGDYAAAEHDIRTGTASTVLRAYVDANAGPGALARRRLPGLVLGSDPLIGTTVTGRARFPVLLDLLSDLALAAADDGSDLGFRVAQVGTDLRFEVYQPRDLTAEAVFSYALGNLAGFEYELEWPEANYLYTGGQGEGTARAFDEGGDWESIARFRDIAEAFQDARDVADAGELAQRRLRGLAEGAARSALRLTPVDTDALTFGTHYGLGDRVQVVADGEAIEDVIREVSLRLDPEEGDVLTPVVGPPTTLGAGVLSDIFRSFQRLAGRVGNLEAKQ